MPRRRNKRNTIIPVPAYLEEHRTEFILANQSRFSSQAHPEHTEKVDSPNNLECFFQLCITCLNIVEVLQDALLLQAARSSCSEVLCKDFSTSEESILSLIRLQSHHWQHLALKSSQHRWKLPSYFPSPPHTLAWAAHPFLEGSRGLMAQPGRATQRWARSHELLGLASTATGLSQGMPAALAVPSTAAGDSPEAGTCPAGWHTVSLGPMGRWAGWVGAFL